MTLANMRANGVRSLSVMVGAVPIVVPDARPGPSCAAPPIPDKAEVSSRKRLFPVGNLANLKMSRDVVI
jgi:hypothetical protein